MGEPAHNTTRVPTNDHSVLRTRLKRDLESLTCVRSVRDDMAEPLGVVFETAESKLRPDVLRVLADHGASVPSAQPDHSRTHSAIIQQ